MILKRHRIEPSVCVVITAGIVLDDKVVADLALQGVVPLDSGIREDLTEGALARSHQTQMGGGGVDCIDSMVAGEIYEDEEHNSPQQALLEHIEGMPYAEKQAGQSCCASTAKVGYRRDMTS